MLSPITILFIKASVLLIVLLAGARVLRTASASARHHMWTAAFAALLALPLFGLGLPAFRIGLPEWATTNASPQATPARDPLPRSSTEAPGPERAVPGIERPPVAADTEARTIGRTRSLGEALMPSLPVLLIALWLVGAVIGLAALLIATWRVRRLERRASELADPAWRASAARIAERLGMHTTIRLLASGDVKTPMAGGIARPTVFLPADAATWSGDVRDIVLVHEIAHLASRDPLRHMVSRLAMSLYWPHPLAWLAARRATLACEQACDESVLAAGIRPSTYATVLLDFAMAPPMRLSAALPIVRPSILELRLQAILHRSTVPGLRRRPLAVGGGVIVLTMCLAAAQPAPQDGFVEAVPSVINASVETVGPKATPTWLSNSSIAAPTSTERTVEQTISGRQQACWSEVSDRRSFEGSVSVSERDGTTMISEQVGRRGSDLTIQKIFDDVRVCAVARDIDGPDMNDVPSNWSRRSNAVTYETRFGNELRRLEIVDGRVSYTVNGASRPIDDATAWRAALFALLDDTWRASRLRGQVSTLRGEISTIYGERSTLLGEISTLRGEVSTMRGEISTLRGEESTLRGEISTIKGHESTLRGAISSERGAISSLQASRWDGGSDRTADLIRRHEQRIREIEDEIRRFDAEGRVREVERQIARRNFDREVAQVEEAIREFDLDDKVAAIERRIQDLDVAGRVREIERDIESLDLDGNLRRLEPRMSSALRDLRSVLRAR